MATLKPAALDFDPALIPSGALWLPRASLSACLRGVMVRSTVGAGDVLLAAFLFTVTAGGSFADALSSAVGWAAAKVEQPGTTMPTEPLRGA